MTLSHPAIISRLLLAGGCFLSFCLPVKSQAADTFIATLKTGDPVAGNLGLRSVKIRTSYGYAVVEIDKLGSIAFGSPDVIRTIDQHEIRGALVQKSFPLRAGKKRLSIRRPQLLSIARAGFGSTSISGKWCTNFGPMELTQSGRKVVGTYGYSGTALRGTVADGHLELEYDSGSAEFDLSEDGKLLKGQYASANGRKGFWGGYRIRAAVARPEPGRITSGQTASWLNYHLRVPKAYSAQKRYPAIAFLHGSNMTSRAYVNTIASVWPKLAEEYILVGFDGENLSPGAKPGRLAYNYSYVNFSGHEVGSKGRYRQSPGLVAEALDQLKRELPIEHWFLGGHSQGGFLTYAVGMFYPDKVAGLFPMSCNLIVQCEPSFFAKKPEAFRSKQRELPIAIIHGENDNVVKFSAGQHCFRSMIDGGFPMVRFFRDKTGGHMFARLPVETAVRWLEKLHSKDATTLLSFAESALEAGRYRDATAATLRLQKLGVPGDLGGNVDRVKKDIEAKARRRAKRLTTAIEKNRDNEWVEDFLSFRREFAFAAVAGPVLKAYAELRKKHAKPADELFYAARRIRDEKQRNARLQKILDEYYASKWYEVVKGWLDD